MLKREGSIGGADTDAPMSPAIRRDDSFEWETPAAVPEVHSDDLTDAERAAIDRANEEARRRRAEALAAMAPATGEYERPPAPKQRAMILFENVTKVYPGNVTGLQDVSLQIDKGEWVFLVGASGSGKSTMIKLLLKEIDATRGNVIVGGRSLSKLRRSRIPQLRRNIGCVFQDFKLLPNRTVFDNVAYALRCRASAATRSSARCRRSSPRRPRREDGQVPERALRRPAAARLDRARVRQPPAAPDLRRAHGQPRPRDVDRDHAAAVPHPAHRHDGAHGHA